MTCMCCLVCITNCMLYLSAATRWRINVFITAPYNLSFIIINVNSWRRTWTCYRMRKYVATTVGIAAVQRPENNWKQSNRHRRFPKHANSGNLTVTSSEFLVTAKGRHRDDETYSGEGRAGHLQQLQMNTAVPRRRLLACFTARPNENAPTSAPRTDLMRSRAGDRSSLGRSVSRGTHTDGEHIVLVTVIMFSALHAANHDSAGNDRVCENTLIPSSDLWSGTNRWVSK